VPRVKHVDRPARRPWSAIEVAAFMAALYTLSGNGAPARLLVEQIATQLLTRSKIG